MPSIPRCLAISICLFATSAMWLFMATVVIAADQRAGACVAPWACHVRTVLLGLPAALPAWHGLRFLGAAGVAAWRWHEGHLRTGLGSRAGVVESGPQVHGAQP